MANPNLKRIVKTSTTLSLKGTLDSDTGSINTEEDNYDLLVLLEFFDDKEIDFFSPDCFTRYIIKIYFDILIIHGISDLSWLMNNANKIRFVSNYLPFLSNITFGKVIERYNKICEDIRNFHFSNNKDVIINFFSNK